MLSVAKLIRQKDLVSGIDWILFFAILPILGAGLLTMSAFVGDDYFFTRQVLWITIALAVFFIFSLLDWRFLKRTDVLISLFIIAILSLLFLFVAGSAVRGAQSWLQFGGFSFQPSDLVKILVILILAKYFSRRHIEIAHIRHIFVSGFYALIPFLLVFFQPDFGSAIIIFFIWLGMIIASSPLVYQENTFSPFFLSGLYPFYFYGLLFLRIIKNSDWLLFYTRLQI